MSDQMKCSDDTDKDDDFCGSEKKKENVTNKRKKGEDTESSDPEVDINKEKINNNNKK